MGYDAACTLRIEGQSSRGTARLEHKDLIFRGDLRLTIPLSTIGAAEADGEVLRVRFGRRSADFVIGPQASRWADRITNPPSRLDKLGVKPGMRVALLDLSEIEPELRARGAEVVTGRAAGANLDVIFLGAPNRGALGTLESLKSRLRPAGALWVVRPKGSPLITEAETMAAGKRAGLVDVKVVSFSDTHTAEKFVIPVAARRALAGRPAAAKRRRPAARRASSRAK